MASIAHTLKTTGTLLHGVAVAIVFGLMFFQTIHAQTGGKAYQFLDVPTSARIASLGGAAAATADVDLNFAYHNPALLDTNMHHHLALNYVDYYAGIHYGYAAFAANLPKKGTFAGGVHYLNYGKFQEADENGLRTGTFRAADYSVNFSYARKVDSLISVGITVKSIYSDLETYHSTAVAFDAGITYVNPGLNFSAGLVLRNIGWQVSTYYPFGDREPLPFNITAAISQRLQYAPLTFFIVAEHLERWDLTYDSPIDEENISFISEGMTEEGRFDRFIDQFMRHMIAGAEFHPSDNLTFRVGYNYRRRQELKISSKPGMVGFSWGVGVKIAKFRVDFGRSAYHLAGGVNYFSLGVNLDELNNNFR